MKVGDVVVPVDGPMSQTLRSGCEHYTHAFVVYMHPDPFVLVSAGGDMMWTMQRPTNFVALCQAHPNASRLAFNRYLKRGRWKDKSAKSELAP